MSWEPLCDGHIYMTKAGQDLDHHVWFSRDFGSTGVVALPSREIISPAVWKNIGVFWEGRTHAMFEDQEIFFRGAMDQSGRVVLD